MYTQKQLEGMIDAQLTLIIYVMLYGKINEDKDMTDLLLDGKIDYCNKWADMGPLILEANIKIIPRPDTHIGSSAAVAWYPHSCQSTCDDNSGLLRAATIVYILIETGEV